MKIVCLGDSLTHGFGCKINENWVELLNQKSSDSYINKGITGDTSGGMLARFQKDVIQENPQRVIILGGLNDVVVGVSQGNILANIMAMVHQSYFNGIIPIVGIGIRVDPFTFRVDWEDLIPADKLNVLIHEYRTHLLQLCKTFHVEYIDFYSEFELMAKRNYTDCFLDGIHPTNEGHRIISEIAERYFYAQK